MESIGYTIISSTGESHVSSIKADEGLKQIQKIVKENNKWLYIDGDHQDPESLDPANLTSKNIIILTDTLMGG